MASRQLSTAELQQLVDLARQWGKIIAGRVTQDNDPLELDFRALEQIAQAAAGGLLQGTPEQLSQRQADAIDPQQNCPHCAKLCTLTREPRNLHEARVKSKQKFWNRPEGAECVLQVRAALLSEDGRQGGGVL